MKLDNWVSNPGELRTRVTLKRRELVEDAGGFVTPGTSDGHIVWCRWINAHGRETEGEIANAESARIFATLLTRWLPDVDETWFVIYQGHEWDVVAVDDLRMRHEWMELRVSRTGAG